MKKRLYIEATPAMAKSIAGSLRRYGAKSSKHRSLTKLAKLTDCKDGELLEQVSRIPDQERKEMMKAFDEMSRVMRTIAGV